MRKAAQGRRIEPWRPHITDAIWIVLLPVAYGFYVFAGIAAAVMASIVASFVLILVRSRLHTIREEQRHHRHLDEGFWNH